MVLPAAIRAQASCNVPVVQYGLPCILIELLRNTKANRFMGAVFRWCFGAPYISPCDGAGSTISVRCAGTTAVRVYFPATQVETPVVPSFEAALSQAEWDALKEERRLAAEAALKVKPALLARPRCIAHRYVCPPLHHPCPQG